MNLPQLFHPPQLRICFCLSKDKTRTPIFNNQTNKQICQISVISIDFTFMRNFSYAYIIKLTFN